MVDRRTHLLDAALGVVGSQGLRALTHRAVDAAAQLPSGSTSNLFRTRADLVAALLDRLVEREVAAWDALRPAPPASDGTSSPASDPGPLDRAAAALADVVRTLCGPARPLSLARQALFHEAAFDPALQRTVTAARARLTGLGIAWLDGLGLRVDAAGVSLLLATVNGMLANQVAGPEPDFDPEPGLRVVLAGVARHAGKST